MSSRVWLLLVAAAGSLYRLLCIWKRRRAVARWSAAVGAPVTDMHDLPGPPHLPFLGCMLSFDPSDFAGFLMKMARQFGDQPWGAFMPGVSMVLIRDPASIAYVTGDPDLFPKGRLFFENFEELLGHGIFAADGDGWRRHRKVSSHMFSSARLRTGMESVFQAHAAEFVRVAREQARQDGGSVIDVQSWLTSVTMDTFTEVAFGRSFDALGAVVRGGTAVPFLQSFDLAQAVTSTRFFLPPVVWKLQRALGIGLQGRLPGALAGFRPVVEGIVDDRLAGRSQGAAAEPGNDLLSLYIEHGRKQGEECSREYLTEMSINLILAGRDTTAALLTHCLRRLDENRDVLEKCRREARSLDLSLKSLSGAVYLDQVLWETLRLNPSVGNDGKQVREDVVLPNGVLVHAGSFIIYHIAGCGRSPALFGADVDCFKPERWERIFADTKLSDLHAMLPVFNAGPRLCLGKTMALFEAKVFLVSLLNAGLRFELAEPQTDSFAGVFTPTPVQFYRNGLKGSFHID